MIHRYGLAMLSAFVLFACCSLIPAGAAETAAPRHFELTYSFELKELPAKANSIIAYLPLPPSNSWQSVAGYKVSDQAAYEVVQDAEYGNRFLRFDLTSAPRDADSGISCSVAFDVLRQTRNVLAEHKSSASIKPSSRFLKPDALVPIDGQIRAEAKLAVGQEHDPLQQIKLCFNRVVDTMDYDKSGKDWGRGDAIYACDVRKGNCTDFHSLFIGMVRSLGIPARFIMGLPLPTDRSSGEIAGYHCWAEFFLPDYGWVPIDASESRRHPEQRAALFGGLDANRVEFTLGRDIVLPKASSKHHNFIIYPYVEVDGQEFAGVERSITFKDL